MSYSAKNIEVLKGLEPALWAIRFGWLLLPFFDMDSPPVGGEAFDVLFGESVML